MRRLLIENKAKDLEARVGFEPTNGGFADLSLRPLGYRAGNHDYSETGDNLSVGARKEKSSANWWVFCGAAILPAVFPLAEG